MSKEIKAIIILAAIIIMALLTTYILSLLESVNALFDYEKGGFHIVLIGVSAVFTVLFLIYFKAYRKLLSSISALLVIGFFVTNIIFTKQDYTHSVKPVKKTVVQKEVNKEIIKSDPQTESKLEEVTKPAPPKPASRYFLIAGSFKDRNMAEAYKKQLESQGYHSLILIREHGPHSEFFKVSFNDFYDRDTAFSELKSARLLKEFENAWLMIW